MRRLRDPLAGLGTRVALRTFLLFCLCAVVPMGLLATLAYEAVDHELRTSAERRLEEASKRYGLLVYERLRQTDWLLREFAKLHAHSEVANTDVFESPYVRVVSVTRSSSPEGQFRDPRSSRTLWFGRSEGIPRVFVSVTLQHDGTSYTVTGEPLPEFLWDTDAAEIPSAQMCVISGGVELQCMGTESDEAAQPMLSREWQLYLRPYFGVDGWSIRTRQPQAVALAGLQTFRSGVPMVAGLAILGALLLSAMQIRRSHRPLQLLTDAAQRLGRGELDAPLQIASDDEYASLARTFNRMVADLQDRERALVRSAYYDSLTGLPNRQLFQDRLEQELVRTRRSDAPVALLFIDLDRFKNVNDSLGHSAGDELLAEVGARLRSLTGESDTLARLGGDEFAISCPGMSALAAGNLARRICDALNLPVVTSAMRCVVQASIGIAIFPRDGSEPGTLLRNAHTAMHRAKALGRGRVVFFEEAMNEQATRRMWLEQRLRAALADNSLELFFQPKVHAEDGAPAGVEALARWHDEREGYISPAEFISIAEEAGLIGKLGDWVLRTACATLRAWLDAGLEIGHVAVNVSTHQLRDASLVDTVAECLREYELPPQSLELEITESALATHPAEVAEVLGRIRALGVSIAIDDFGTGYSSMSLLQQWPANVLKIDRSFVQHCNENANAAALAGALIGVGHALGKQVIAEGVEAVEQAEFLAMHGCSLFQGFLFARPMPADEIPGWYARSANRTGHAAGAFPAEVNHLSSA